MGKYAEYKGDIYDYETAKPVDEGFKFKEGDLLRFEQMPFDKDGRHATGWGRFEVNDFTGQLVCRPIYEES